MPSDLETDVLKIAERPSAPLTEAPRALLAEPSAPEHQESPLASEDVVRLLSRLLESQQRGTETQNLLFSELQKLAQTSAPRSDDVVASLQSELALVREAMEERVNALRDDMRQTFALLSPSIDRALEQRQDPTSARTSERVERLATEFQTQIESLRAEFSRIGEQITGWRNEEQSRQEWADNATRSMDALRAELSIVRESATTQTEFQQELEKDLQSLLVSSQDVVDAVTASQADNAAAEQQRDARAARTANRRALHENVFFGAVILLLVLNALMTLYILGGR